jgi:aminoglycoside 3-N-acetyltransferase
VPMSVDASLEGSFRSALADIGIGDGDFVLVHARVGTAPLSDVFACLNALIHSVQPSGTLAIPTFNFGFCRGVAYDYRKTPSEMGLLTELARRDRRARRIHHPVYGFALFGKDADTLSKTTHNVSAFGGDSIFAELRRRNGKILLIDLQIHECFTFFHHVEEMVGCDYRFHKTFTGRVIDDSGHVAIQSCQVFVRNLEMGVTTDVAPMGERLESLGLVRHGTLGRWSLRLLEAAPVFEATRKVPLDQPHLLRQVSAETALGNSSNSPEDDRSN